MADDEAAGTISQAVEKNVSDILGANGCMITGFLGIVTYIDTDGDNCWSFMRSDHAIPLPA